VTTAGAGLQIYFEDVVVGERLVTPAMTLTRAHVTLYRGLAGEDLAADPDEVPALLPLCVSTGLGWRINRPPLAVMAFMGVEWSVLAPARVGDTVHGRATALSKRTMRDVGVIIEGHEIVNHHGEVVQQGKLTYLVAKRPKEAAS
jgi:hypothetical protein